MIYLIFRLKTILILQVISIVPQIGQQHPFQYQIEALTCFYLAYRICLPHSTLSPPNVHRYPVFPLATRMPGVFIR